MKQATSQIWNIGAETKGRSDFEFFVTEDNKYGIYFSRISEYGMMKFVSPAQIWTDKDNPRLLFRQDEIRFEFQHTESCYYLGKSVIVVLLMHCNINNRLEMPYVLFDFTKGQFAIINNPNFIPTELEPGVIRLDVHFRYFYDGKTKTDLHKNNGKQISLNELKWYKLNELVNVCSLV